MSTVHRKMRVLKPTILDKFNNLLLQKLLLICFIQLQCILCMYSINIDHKMTGRRIIYTTGMDIKYQFDMTALAIIVEHFHSFHNELNTLVQN